MALFVLMFLTPMFVSVGLLVYWLVISIIDRDFIDVVISSALILSVIGTIGMLLF